MSISTNFHIFLINQNLKTRVGAGEEIFNVTATLLFLAFGRVHTPTNG